MQRYYGTEITPKELQDIINEKKLREELNNGKNTDDNKEPPADPSTAPESDIKPEESNPTGDPQQPTTTVDNKEYQGYKGNEEVATNFKCDENGKNPKKTKERLAGLDDLETKSKENTFVLLDKKQSPGSLSGKSGVQDGQISSMPKEVFSKNIIQKGSSDEPECNPGNSKIVEKKAKGVLKAA